MLALVCYVKCTDSLRCSQQLLICYSGVLWGRPLLRPDTCFLDAHELMSLDPRGTLHHNNCLGCPLSWNFCSFCLFLQYLCNVSGTCLFVCDPRSQKSCCVGGVQASGSVCVLEVEACEK